MPKHIHNCHEHGEVYVSQSKGDDTNCGSIYAPYKTVQKALDDGNQLIHILPGSYQEDITVPSSYGNFGPVIWANNVHDSQKTEIIGTVTLPAGLSRFRCYGLQFDGGGTATALLDNSSEGRHYFENCTFNNSGSEDCVKIVNGKRWFEFVRSVVDGKLNLDGTGSNCSVRIKHTTNSTNCDVTVNDGYSFGVHYAERMGVITHNGGHVQGTFVSSWTPDGSGNIINSTADLPSSIYLGWCNLTSDGLTYGKVNSTGTAIVKTFSVDDS